MLLFVLLAASAGCDNRPVPKARQPNIILITVDALRPDHLSCYGYPRKTSPAIDRLAEEGAVFTQAIAQSTYTYTSVTSFFTSASLVKYAYIGHMAVVLDPYFDSYVSLLKRHGYTTALLNDHPGYFEQSIGVKKDFDVNVQLELNHPQELTRVALETMEKLKNKKFFLWLYYFGAHGPYVPSSPYAEKFMEDGLAKDGRHVPIASSDYGKFFGVIARYIADKDITSVDYYTALYDGKIHLIDDQIALLLDQVKKLGLEEETLIVLNADHGEAQGEHNQFFGHGYTLYDEVVRVPFIMKYLPLIAKGKRIACQVALLDLMPTILDVAGVGKSRLAEGISLKPLLLGKIKKVRNYIFSSAEIVFSIRSEAFKLIYVRMDKIKTIPRLSRRMGGYYLSPYELYDLKNDPLEQHNVYQQKKDVVRILKPLLDAYILAFRQQYYHSKRNIIKYYGRKKGSALVNDTTYEHFENSRNETILKMKSLGYAQ